MRGSLLPVILLLVGCELRGSGGCTFDLARSHCTCSFAALADISSLADCIQAFVFEFRDGHFVNPMAVQSLSLQLPLLVPFLQRPIDKIILGNSVLHEYFLLTFLIITREVNIRELVFEDCAFIGRANWQVMEGKSPRVSYLQFSNVSSASLADRGKDFADISSWMAHLQNIILTRSQVTRIPQAISMHFKGLRLLDLSENLLQDQGVNDSFSEGLFPRLMSLKLRHNNLTSFDMVCKALSKLPNLQDSDLSQNNFSSPPSCSCEWPASMRLLNLSDTGLEHVNAHLLPQSIEILDLSYNKLSTLDASLPHLKEIYVPNNRLDRLPSSKNFPNLEVLILDANRITHLSKDLLQAFTHLSTLRADGNPYTCSCSVVNDMKQLPTSSFVVQQWPAGYLCDSPSEYKGFQVNEAECSVFEYHKPLFIGIICAVVLLVCIVAAVCLVRTHWLNRHRA